MGSREGAKPHHKAQSSPDQGWMPRSYQSLGEGGLYHSPHNQVGLVVPNSTEGSLFPVPPTPTACPWYPGPAAGLRIRMWESEACQLLQSTSAYMYLGFCWSLSLTHLPSQAIALTGWGFREGGTLPCSAASRASISWVEGMEPWGSSLSAASLASISACEGTDSAIDAGKPVRSRGIPDPGAPDSVL